MSQDSLASGSVFKKLKLGSVITGAWNSHWEVQLLSRQVHTSADISLCNKLASEKLIKIACNRGLTDYTTLCHRPAVLRIHTLSTSKTWSWSLVVDSKSDLKSMPFSLGDGWPRDHENRWRQHCITCSPKMLSQRSLLWQFIRVKVAN